MCTTRIRYSPICGHAWLELYHRCAPYRNLLTCPDFSASQPRGPASIPHTHGLPCCTPMWACPRCGDEKPDQRYKRICEFRAAGIKIGRDAGRNTTGAELVVARHQRLTPPEYGVGCCAIM